jgi:hypothetical protein
MLHAPPAQRHSESTLNADEPMANSTCADQFQRNDKVRARAERAPRGSSSRTEVHPLSDLTGVRINAARVIRRRWLLGSADNKLMTTTTGLMIKIRQIIGQAWVCRSVGKHLDRVLFRVALRELLG